MAFHANKKNWQTGSAAPGNMFFFVLCVFLPRWWFLIFLECSPLFGEDEPNLTSICFRWVQTTNQLRLKFWHHVCFSLFCVFFFCDVFPSLSEWWPPKGWLSFLVTASIKMHGKKWDDFPIFFPKKKQEKTVSWKVRGLTPEAFQPLIPGPSFRTTATYDEVGIPMCKWWVVSRRGQEKCCHEMVN